MLRNLSTFCSTAIEEVCCTGMFVLLFLVAAVLFLIKYVSTLSADDFEYAAENMHASLIKQTINYPFLG